LGWDEQKIALANEMLERATVGKTIHAVRRPQPRRYDPVDPSGLKEAGYGPDAKVTA